MCEEISLCSSRLKCLLVAKFRLLDCVVSSKLAFFPPFCLLSHSSSSVSSVNVRRTRKHQKTHHDVVRRFWKVEKSGSENQRAMSFSCCWRFVGWCWHESERGRRNGRMWEGIKMITRITLLRESREMMEIIKSKLLFGSVLCCLIYPFSLSLFFSARNLHNFYVDSLCTRKLSSLVGWAKNSGWLTRSEEEDESFFLCVGWGKLGIRDARDKGPKSVRDKSGRQTREKCEKERKLLLL